MCVFGEGGLKMRGKNEEEDMGHYVIRRADTLGSMDHFTVISVPHLHHPQQSTPPMTGVAALIWVIPANSIGLAARTRKGGREKEDEREREGKRENVGGPSYFF